MANAARQLVGDSVHAVTEIAARRTAPILLELDLTVPLADGIPPDPVSRALNRRHPELRAVLDGLRRARTDPQVTGLLVRLGGGLGLARAQELRAAVQAFRAAGKRAVAWAESFGELGGGTAAYVLASAFDEIWLQPAGALAVTGVAVRASFLRDALAKVGVEPEVEGRYEYKNAVNRFTEQSFTPAHREAAGRIAASAAEQVVAAIADGRDLAPDEVRALVDRAPLSAAEAQAAGLVDRVGYRDEVYAAALEQAGEGARLRFVTRYAAAGRAGSVRKRVTDRPAGTVALVHVVGAIHGGRSGRTPLSGPSTGSDTVGAALRAARGDEAVKAVVLRVDSPGGDVVASVAIWREVLLTRESGRPVIVSMGTVAGSGGYYVAAPATLIVAEPGTLTGSIGVFGGKVVAAELSGRLGVGHESVAEGVNAELGSEYERFTPGQWELLRRYLDEVYDDFTAKVAEGRGLSRDEVHEVARGRVWTGADAADRGLVDELGGMERALELAKREAGIPYERRALVRPYPQVPLVARIRPPENSEHPAASAARLGWGSFAGMAAALGLPVGGALTMPPFQLSS